MKIHIATDHAGLELKNIIRDYLIEKGHDVMSAFFYYYFFQKLNFASVLSKSIAAGSLHVSGFISTKINYLKMIDELSEKIKVRIKKSVR